VGSWRDRATSTAAVFPSPSPGTRNGEEAVSAAGEVHVVHLVRHGNPPESLERFLDSYRRLDAGVAHRLVLLCKGFPSQAALKPILAALDGVASSALQVPDDGFDLTAYRRAAEHLDGALCFLNSNSVLLAPRWLEHLVAALSPSVGIAGATGSWNGGRSNICYSLRLPGAYSEVFPDRSWYREQSRRLGRDSGARDPRLTSRPPLRYVRTASEMMRYYTGFRPFPAPHVRTNAFVIRSETMRRLAFRPLRSKMRAWRLESGRGSITEQIASMGLDAVVVGRGGELFASAEWPQSETFWQSDQENLLVADNQTETYAQADLELRTLLAGVAWGLLARPTSPADRV